MFPVMASVPLPRVVSPARPAMVYPTLSAMLSPTLVVMAFPHHHLSRENLLRHLHHWKNFLCRLNRKSLGRSEGRAVLRKGRRE